MVRKLECMRCGSLNRAGTPCRCLANYNVRQLDEARPHLTVNCKDAVHVIPVSLIDDVINGNVEFTDIENWQSLIKVILREWIEKL